MLRSLSALVVLTISWSFVLPAPVSGQAAQQTVPPQHEVVQGNTLWDLAEIFYGNPFEWRRIWEANQDRLDNPDLIYPGQVLRIPGADGQMMEVMVMPGGGQVPAAETEIVAELPERTMWYPDTTFNSGAFDVVRQSFPAVQPEIVYSAPFLVGNGMPMTSGMGALVGFAGAANSRTPRESARRNDRVFLEFEGAVAPAPGALLQTYAMTEYSVGDLGMVARPTGIIRVVGRDQGRQIGVVERVFARMLPEDRLRVLPAYSPRPGVEPSAVAAGATVQVAGFALQSSEIHGPGDFLFLALGSDDGVSIGDEYVVRMPGSGAQAEGRFRIVNVASGTSTGRIMALRNTVFTSGVEATLERRMPGR